MQPVIDTIELRTDLARVTLKGLPDRPGVVSGVFTALGELGFNVETISQVGAARDRCDIAFAIQASQSEAVLEHLHGRLTELDARGVLVDKSLALIVLSGEKLATTPGIAGRAFGILGRLGVNIEVISAGLFSLALMVPRDRAPAAAQALKEGLGLN